MALFKQELTLNWDDLKFFLAVAREGSIRAAAKSLNVNHATVSRRIRQFEATIGNRLFERNHAGYVTTRLGEEILQEAMHLEERLSTVSRMMAGHDQQLKGNLRITLPETIGDELLMDDLADFCQMHPQVDLELIESLRPFNLANREADVALRICTTPPDHLIGRKVASIHRACYYSVRHAQDLLTPDWLTQGRWIGWDDRGQRPAGQIAADYPRFRSGHKMMSAALQKQACKAGMGVGILLCYMADEDPELFRIPPYTSEHKYDLWLLYHPDLRTSAKVQTFVRFITERITQKKDLLEGKAYRPRLTGSDSE